MITVATGLILVVAIFAIVLFVARRLLRLAIKLAFVGAVILALTGGGLFGWWRGWFESSPSRAQRDWGGYGDDGSRSLSRPLASDSARHFRWCLHCRFQSLC